MTMRGLVVKCLVVLFSALASAGAMAAHPQIAAQDLALLPPYCKPRLGALIGGGGFDKAEFDSWANSLGPEFVHIHHYCWAQHYMILYHRSVADPKRGSYYLSRVLANIDYVLERARPVFVLLPEIETKKGKTLLLMGRDSEAVQLLTRVTQKSPAYVGAYQQLGEYYADRKQKAKALEVIEAGLERVPASRLLQRLYKELGGTKPLAEIRVTPVESASEPKSNTAEAVRQPVTTPDNQTDIQRPTDQTNPPSVQGTPSNPYCRFCPDQ